jgi:hypothetical protein
MLGMLRRARERREERERNCPCKQTCLCHQPDPDAFPSWMPYWMQLLIVLSPIWVMVLLVIVNPPKPEKRHVRVGNKICEVIFMKTGEKCEDHLLHHECKDEGYDEAVCPR